MNYTPRTFSLPQLVGLSQEQIKAHLALYEGYVKHANLIAEKLEAMKDDANNAYTMNELRRRFAFEFNGMRMHEYYFEQFEQGPTSLTVGCALEGLTEKIREVAGTRGIGWVAVYFDPTVKTLHTVFVNDHELGQLAGLPIILALDLWEHAYMVDYLPSEKPKYIDAFFANLNWGVAEKRFSYCQ